MPATRLALSLTNAYRFRLAHTQELLAAQIRMAWARLDTNDLDGSHAIWSRSAQSLTTAAQTEMVKLSHGYLTAFLTAELGEPTAAVSPTGNYIGNYRDGGPLPMTGSLVAVKSALVQGQPLERALAAGLRRALLVTSQATDHAGTQSLMDAIHADDRIHGWERSVRGTCGACLGAAVGHQFGLMFPKHPGCRCVASPVVRGVQNTFKILTGAAIFAAKTEQEQDDAVGPEVAAAVRAGDIELSDLVGHSQQKRGADYLTQAKAA